jgi:hypothetical protein
MMMKQNEEKKYLKKTMDEITLKRIKMKKTMKHDKSRKRIQQWNEEGENNLRPRRGLT